MLLLLPVAEGNSGASRTLWQIGGDIPVLVLAFATPMLILLLWAMIRTFRTSGGALTLSAFAAMFAAMSWFHLVDLTNRGWDIATTGIGAVVVAFCTTLLAAGHAAHLRRPDQERERSGQFDGDRGAQL